MRIVDARIKVSFTTEEDRALRTTINILERLKVKNPMAFLVAYSDNDWIYYDDDETVIEFLDNNSEPEDDT